MNNEIDLKPFLRWAGGKQNFINDLIKHIPQINENSAYFEPFLGAGSLFFACNFKNVMLSDINNHLVNTYKCIKLNPYLIHHKLQYLKSRLTQDYYYNIRSKFNKNINNYSYQQAARFIFLVHTSFNGIYRVNTKGLYNVPFGKIKPSLPSLEQLYKISNKLKNAKIINGSYQLISNLVKAEDFIYLDPPYPAINNSSSFQHYTIGRFSNEEQTKLATFANELSNKGCNVMITNANTKLIRDLYVGWTIKKMKQTRFITCKKIRHRVTELIITNY